MCSWQYRIFQRARMIAALVVAMGNCCLHSTTLEAAQVVALAMNEKAGIYQLALEVILSARSDDVHHVITDYDHIYRIDPAIVESGIMGKPGASVTRVRTLINGCVLLLCRPIVRVEDVRETGNDDIYSVVVPELSNVRSGTEHWRIHPIGNETRISFHSTLEPGFFVPPLVGSPLVEKKIRDETLICFNNIERIARIRGEQVKAHNATQGVTLSKSTDSAHDEAN